VRTVQLLAQGVSTLRISTRIAAISTRIIKITPASSLNRRYNSKDPVGTIQRTTQVAAIIQGISAINLLRRLQVSPLIDIFSLQVSCDQEVPRSRNSIRQPCIRIGHKRVHRRSSQSRNSRLQWGII